MGKKKLLGKLGAGKQSASEIWDPGTIPEQGSSWGRESSSREGGDREYCWVSARGMPKQLQNKGSIPLPAGEVMVSGTWQEQAPAPVTALGYLAAPAVPTPLSACWCQSDSDWECSRAGAA